MKSRGEIVSLQVARGMAATAVVYHHAARAATVNRPSRIVLPDGGLSIDARWSNVGAVGVDLFFVLSGFLMIYISKDFFNGKRAPSEFITNRMVRVWPMYAIATFCALVQEWVLPSLAAVKAYDFRFERLLSFFFLPSFNNKGLLFPIVGVGWTLNYEVFFYICFALTISMRTRFPILLLGSLLAAAYLGGTAAPNSALGQFLHNDILFEFLAGACVARFVQRGWTPVQGWIWIAAGCFLLLSFTAFISVPLPRLLTGGLPVLLIFCGFLALDNKTRFPKWMVRIGDASFSIYLFHIFVAAPAVNRAMVVLINFRVAKAAVPIATLTAVIICLIIGVAIHWFVERPVLREATRLANYLLKRQSPSPLVARDTSLSN